MSHNRDDYRKNELFCNFERFFSLQTSGSVIGYNRENKRIRMTFVTMKTYTTENII
jgi:hypothetical protein